MDRRNFLTAAFLVLFTCLVIAIPGWPEGESTRPSSDLGQDERFQALMSLPYLQGYDPVPEKTNVIKYDRARAYQGYNLYSSGHGGEAFLIDMKGEVLHQWRYELKDIWPKLAKKLIAPFWEDIYLYPNGDLLAIFNRGGMIKLDKDSRLLWATQAPVHHHIDVDEDGNIYTLTEERMTLREDVDILDNCILILSAQGNILERISLMKMMLQSQRPVIKEITKRVLGIALNGGQDVFHTNTLKILDGSQAQRSSTYQKGNLMISMLTISCVGIINPRQKDFEWMLGPVIWFQGQHNPTLLPNGNILTFDNHLDGSNEQSRVLEFDPFSRQVVWEYREPGFYSDSHGSQARLPNGNTLIVESNAGRVFEVTPQKEIVWEFVNPHITGNNIDLVAAVLGFYRIDPSSVASWLKN